MRIAQYLGHSPWGDVTPDNAALHGMGGRETACVMLGEEWARLGHEVINFVPLTGRYRNADGGALYADREAVAMYLRNFGADVLVSWEDFQVIVQRGVRENVGRIVVGAQVADLEPVVDGTDVDELVDAYGVLSPWHAEHLVRTTGIARSKMFVTPNGIAYGSVHSDEDSPIDPGAPPEFVYSSSPDRGLHHLLALWPRIRSTYPGARLHVCYGIEQWANQLRWSHNMQSSSAIAVIEGVEQEGVVYHGRVGQDELHEVQRRCSALLYPCDTMSPTETGCITIIEACAANAVPVITDCDCLGSEFGHVGTVCKLPYDPDSYMAGIAEGLENRDSMLSRMDDFAQTRDWGAIAPVWRHPFGKEV